MTRLLCFGDLHLDAGTQHRENALADQEAALEQIVDIAAAERCDVLFAGDAYHRPHASDGARHVMRRFLQRLEDRGLTFVGVLGNASHDQYGTDRETALELEHRGEGILVSRHPEILGAGGVAICTLPSVPVSRLVAASNGGDRSRIYEQAAELLVETARGLRARVDGPAVLLGHWSVSGASLPNGLPVADLNEPILDLAALDAIGFDAIVLGHIHNPERLPSVTPAFYTGSPVCLSFGEAHVPHGVWILDIGNPEFIEDGANPQFVPLDDRRFVTVDVEFLPDGLDGGYLDETDAIAADIAEQFPLDGAIVRVRYTATEAQHRRIDQAAIRRLITDAGGRCYQIAPDIIRESRARAEHVDESLTPVMAVQAWGDANELVIDRTNALVHLTRDLLEEVA